eukprot:6357366-Prymnesium_polylepis.1
MNAEETERLLHEQAEAERERQIADMSRRCFRKMMHQGVARAFDAWAAKMEEAVWQRRKLAGAAGRMMRPHLT